MRTSPVSVVWLILLIVLMTLPGFAGDDKGWRKKHPEWKLVFSDDFKGKRLNTRKWNKIRYLDGRVADWRRYQSRDDGLVVVNGNSTVSLWGKWGDYTSQADQMGKEDTYACGGIFTNETFSFQYGYVEVRAQFECAQGAWPAIWMMPVDGSHWPARGEIDIMEHLNREDVVHQTIHYNNASGRPTKKAIQPGAARFESKRDRLAFHTYGVEWTEEGITFYMDGKVTGFCPAESANPNWPFHQENNPYYLLLDMQLGGSWVGKVDRDDLGEGVAMTIDYVRVYADPDNVSTCSSSDDRSKPKKAPGKKRSRRR